MAKDIVAWLQAQGMSRYADAFEAQHIDLALLPRIDHAALIELGVTSLGHRLRLLEAIERESRSGSSPSMETDSAHSEEAPTERRQLTVMFCDLVDSTRLAAGLDAEDLRHVITAYQDAAKPAVERYGGHIAQYLGDGLLVYFGYPEAHEDDAVRAVHAGLDLLARLQDLNGTLRDSHAVELSVRIGIHTGPVVVGQIGSADQSNPLATGMAPNRAAHLQQRANDNSVLVSSASRDLLGQTFTLRGAGDDAFQVMGTRSIESRFVARGSSDASGLIGRRDEMTLLRGLWAEARSGVGRAVCVSGEAGIGKSRLVEALADDIASEPSGKILYQCSPYHLDSPLYPARRQLDFALRAMAHATADATARPTLDDLEAALSNAATDGRREARLLADLVDLDAEADARYGALDCTPRERRERTLGALLDQLVALAHRHPVLFVLEDAQWSDATTLELARQALERIGAVPVLVVVTCRPDAELAWCSSEAVRAMPLRRLDADSVRTLIGRIGGERSLAAAWVERIVDRSDGVPLFAEELAKALLQTSSASGRDTAAGADAEPVEIPASLQDSLMARLDRMRSVKRIAQMAACIGREFERRDLAVLAAVSDEDLAIALERLCAAEILLPSRGAREDGFLFRHALLRDAAYESLPRASRQALHGALFDELIARPDSSPDVLGHHALEARRYREAAVHFDEAGQRAAARAAFEEAIAHFERAVSCTQRMEDSVEARTMELDARVHQGHASTALNGFAHPLTAQINIQARALLDRVDDSPYRFPVMYGHWVIQHALGQHPTALRDATALHREMQSSDDRVKRLVGHRVRGSTRLMLGEFAGATDDLHRALSLREEEEDSRLAARFGIDLIVPVRTYGALAHVCQGEATRAAQLLEGLEDKVRRQAHPGTMIYAFSHLALVTQAARLPRREHHVRIADELADEFGVMAYKGHTLGIRAMLLLERDALDDGIECMAESLAIIERTKTRIYTPLLYASHAFALARRGDRRAAREAAATATAMADAGRERWALAEIHRLVALAGAESGASAADTREALLGAIELAEGQGALLWSLRAATSLAEALAGEGRRSDAAPLLAEKLGRFPDSGHDLQDRRAACDLLERIRA